MEDLDKKNKKKIKRFQTINAAAVIVLFLTSMAFMYGRGFGIGFYLTASVIIWWILFINSIFDCTIYNNIYDFSLFINLKVLFGGLFSTALCLVLYQIIFSPDITADKYYVSYQPLIITVIFYISIVNIHDRIMKNKIEKEKDIGFIQVSKIVLTSLLTYLFTFGLPFYQFYDERYEVSLYDLKIPTKLEAKVISKPDYSVPAKPPGGTLKPNTKVMIEDKELIKDLMDEIRPMQLENIRNLERINYTIMKERNYPCISFYGYYDSDSPEFFGEVEKGYFSSINIYDNGQVILESYKQNHSFLKYDFFRYFKVPLSKDMSNRLKNACGDLKFKSP